MHHLLPLRRFEEARGHLEVALAVDPLSATVHVSRAALLYYERDHERAAGAIREVVEDHPEFGLAHMLLGLSLLGAGDPDRALPVLQHARRLTGGSVEATVAYGQGLAVAGSTEEATRLLETLRVRRDGGYVSAARVAQLEAALGDGDAATSSLERAIEDRAADLVWLDVTNAFEGLRGDPRFRAVRDRVLPAE
jgi:tetratricopeptide (TPR) repeat protein